MRKCAYIFVAFALASFARCAHAQSNNYSDTSPACIGGYQTSYCHTKNAAQDAVLSWKTKHNELQCGPLTVTDRVTMDYGPNIGYCSTPYRSVQAFFEVDNCPGGMLDPLKPGECLTDEKCRARNVDLGDSSGAKLFTSAQTNTCNAGCTMDFVNGSRGPVVKSTWYKPNADGVSYSAVNGYTASGSYEYTGYMCGAKAPSSSPSKDAPQQTPENKPKKQDCVLVGNLTQCQRADGTQCTQVAGTTSICWKPGETGTKTDGNMVQKATPGISGQPDTIALPNGDTATKTGSVGAQTTINNNTSNVTITNYQTSSGANAGPSSSNSGEPMDGSRPNGDKDKNGNSSGGGGDCSTPPVSSGDAILAQIAMQTWQTRCQSERTDQGAKQKGQAMSDSDSSVDDSAGTVFKDGAPVGTDTSLSTNYIGTGAGGCPTPPALELGGQTFAWPDNFCDILAKIRTIVIGCGYLIGAIMVLKR